MRHGHTWRLSKRLEQMRHLARALAHRNYALYFSAQILSQAGTHMQQVAMSWLVFRLTGSTFMLGFVAFMGQFPTLIFGPFVGLLADRVERRKVLFWTQFASLVHSVALAVLTAGSEIRAEVLVIMWLLLGLINAIDQPVRQALIAELVPRREDLPNAVALTSVTIHSSRLIGPALGGVLIAQWGESACFLVNAASYSFVLAALCAIRLQERPAHKPGQSVIGALSEGFGYTLEHRYILLLLSIVAMISFFSTPYISLLPYFAKEVYGGDAQSFGFMTAAAGAGAFSGTLFLAGRRTVFDIDRTIVAAVLASGFALALFARTDQVPLAVAALFVIGFCSINIVAASNVLIQSVVADRMRGRVMGLFTMAFFGISPIGSLAIGSAGQSFGVRDTLTCCAAVIMLTGIVAARLRKNIPHEALVTEHCSAQPS